MGRAGYMDNSAEVPRIPEALPVNFNGIPPELQRYPFVLWKYVIIDGDVKKPPFDPKTGRHASVADQSTWGSFEDAQEAYLNRKWGKMHGVGIVLNGGLVGIDIDDCIHQGSINPQALHLISMADTFTEFSPTIPEGEITPSGVHLWLKGKMPGLFCRNDHLKVEMYERRRYMTVTGHLLHGSRGYLQEDQDRLAAIYNEVFAYSEPIRDTGGGVGRSQYFTYVSHQKALDRAYRANYAEKFRRLYEGDTSLWEDEKPRYASQSNADFALVLYLLRVTNNDLSQVDMLFRRSGLMRPKWDRKVNKTETYGQRTLRRALEERKKSQNQRGWNN